jgi:hypothetical protein
LIGLDQDGDDTKMGKKASSSPDAGQYLLPAGSEIREYELSELELDGNNPRLGNKAGTFTSQDQILDEVVDRFGVEDILSSLAVNGYFAAEPLVGFRSPNSTKITIAEGNRRLAACLILARDTRARHHEKRHNQYKAIQERHSKPAITSIPVRVLPRDRQLTSYLGVRHIAAPQPWDSYAKAKWIDDVLNGGDLTLEDVSEMIGDQHRTVARILEGYRFVRQLIDAAQFVPGESLRAGKGSNPEYPFSWVYTALGYSPIRNWLSLQDGSRNQSPLPTSKLDDAGRFMKLLFGSKSGSDARPPAITDSRQISELAKAIANPESRAFLLRGKPLSEVLTLARPATDRVADYLLDAQEALNSAIEPFNAGQVVGEEASPLLEPSKRVRALANEMFKKVTQALQNDPE